MKPSHKNLPLLADNVYINDALAQHIVPMPTSIIVNYFPGRQPVWVLSCKTKFLTPKK